MATTQPRAFGAFTGKPYGSFAGREDTRVTQPRSFGAFTGMRYGSFAGRVEVTPEPPVAPTLGGGYWPVPRRMRDALRDRRIEEDDLLLLMAACLDGKALH